MKTLTKREAGKIARRVAKVSGWSNQLRMQIGALDAGHRRDNLQLTQLSLSGAIGDLMDTLEVLDETMADALNEVSPE